MKTSLEECSKRAPRGRGGGKILPGREREQGGHGHQHRRSGLQRCRLGRVRPPERTLEAACATHPALGQLAPSGHACFFAGCRVHLCRFRGSGAPGARHSEGGRGLRVAASGSYDRIAVSTPVPGPEGAAAPWAAWSSLTETADGSAVAASRALRVSPGGDVAAACPGMSLTPTCQR